MEEEYALTQTIPKPFVDTSNSQIFKFSNSQIGEKRIMTTGRRHRSSLSLITARCIDWKTNYASALELSVTFGACWKGILVGDALA